MKISNAMNRLIVLISAHLFFISKFSFATMQMSIPNDSTLTNNDYINSIELELLGKGGLYSLNYRRKIVEINKLNQYLTIGYSYRTKSLNYPNSFPISTVLSYQMKRVHVNLGVGVALLYSSNGTDLSREEFELYNPNLYRGGIGSIWWGAYHTKFGSEYFYSLGLNYEVKKYFLVGMNYYLFNFYGYDYTRYNQKSFGGLNFTWILK
jgi:hypothetical protein